MNYVKGAFVLCKLKKKTRSRSGVAVDASPAVTDLSPTIISDPILNDSLMLTHHKDPVEDYGGDYCNDLEELTPELDSSRWLDHSYQFDSNHWGSFADTTHSWEQGESSGLLRGENGHVYGQNTVENSNVRAPSTWKTRISTPSSPHTPSTHVFPLSESINRHFEISSASLHHREGTKSRRRKAKEIFTPRSQKPAITELEKPPPPGNKAGGNGAVEASTSRNRNLI
ncbi:hypothetical protein DY000_02044216 [Brassica cretica]|uniref:NAC domain-containing protein n=1 Tax=Brassica cretica TaxID=69181 RepID=A0ABQ7F834_BRACR|nr:hypothetical protein DY000_02044216 [Brassica cretica]